MNKNIKYSQNFLTSEKVLNQIIKQLNLKETDTDRKSTRLNSSHKVQSRMPSSA